MRSAAAGSLELLFIRGKRDETASPFEDSWTLLNRGLVLHVEKYCLLPKLGGLSTTPGCVIGD